MSATVSHYPRVSEWVVVGETALNMAQVASIEFGLAGSSPFAVVRLSTYHAEREAEELGTTWFKLRDAAIVGALRDYVAAMRAPGFTHPTYAHER